MLRALLLYFSRQKQLRRWMEDSSAAARLTRRFVAGKTLERGLHVLRSLHEQGILTTLDRLGENVSSEAEAAAARLAYVEALESLAPLRMEATISVKLTQLGMDLSAEMCGENLDLLAARARELGSVVEVDMESTQYTDRTLRLVVAAHQRYGAVRSVIQAYLYRSEKDVAMLNALGIPVRLCKGAYLEHATHAIQRKRDVDSNYVKLMAMLLRGGVYPALASHDGRILRRALDLIAELGLRPDKLEFQMLYGIRRDLQELLVRKGFRLRLYVPYGEAWYPYFMRRLAERPANLIFLLKNLIRH
jgi:proline dehydrogenase